MSNSDNGIVLIGNGGHARAVRDVIESLNGYSISLGGRVSVAWAIPDSRKLTSKDWKTLCRDYKNFVIAIGQIKEAVPRICAVSKLVRHKVSFPTIISPRAYVSPRAKIGRGTVVMHNATVNAGAVVEEFCIINTGATVEHDALVGAFSHISTNAVVNGGAETGTSVFVGSGAVVLNQIRIFSNVVLGAGSVACCDIEKPGIYRGNPCGRVK